jgi:hypothetical protein
MAGRNAICRIPSPVAIKLPPARRAPCSLGNTSGRPVPWGTERRKFSPHANRWTDRTCGPCVLCVPSRERLAKPLGMPGSDHAGERDNAALAI